MVWFFPEHEFVFEAIQGSYKLFFLTTTCYVLQVLAFKPGKNLKIQLIDLILQFLFNSKPPFPPSSSASSCFSTNIEFVRNIKFHPICTIYMSLKIRSHSSGIDHWSGKLDSHPSLVLTVCEICVGFTVVCFLQV